WGDLYQLKVRFNFLKFDHDPSFKKVPYNQENSKYLNILHVMGRRVEGVEPELYVAHWDLRKTQKLYLNGVPAEHEATVKEAVAKWNKTFQDIGAVAPGFNAFEPVVANFEHPFDLRYPSISWISDIRISMNSPLGIGMAHADVRNGKIVWGGVVLYGGVLERFVNSYAPIDSIQGEVSHFNVSSLFKQASSDSGVNGLNSAFRYFNTNMLGGLAEFAYSDSSLPDNSTQGLGPRAKAELGGKLAPILADLNAQIQKQSVDTADSLRKFQTSDIFGLSALEKSNLNGNESKAAGIVRGSGKEKSQGGLERFGNLNRASSVFIETERTIENLVGPWHQSEARLVMGRSQQEMLKSVVMNLTLHEVGHLLGSGHQFKENIIPKEGTVPSQYIKELKAKANKEAGFTNMTSVMGYQSGRTEMIIPSHDLKPEIHDELVLRYLYKAEYPVFDKDNDRFIYHPLPPSGRLPGVTWLNSSEGSRKPYPIAYFPACNDYEASLGADPFCNRFDRGNSATDIVSSYFSDISDNLITNIYSLAEGAGDSYRAERRLWILALRTFSRVRIFYDEMRRRLQTDLALRPVWEKLRNDKDALLNFSRACMQSGPTDSQKIKSPILRELFSYSDMVDLCRANQLALHEYRYFLTLHQSDMTLVDRNERFISGGYLEGDASRNWGHIFGSWYQLSNLPLKISALHTLTTASPFLMTSYQGLVGNPFYDVEGEKFLYRTLYPNEYTELIAEMVKHNLSFEAIRQKDSTFIGRSVVAAGHFLPTQASKSNDETIVPKSFANMLDSQINYSFGMVAVLIQAHTPDANSSLDPDYYNKFTARVFDPMLGGNINASEVYILPQRDVLVRVNNMFLFPLTKVKFYDSGKAYVIAYKVDYDPAIRDDLE
ncbi:MAG: hypothetical protein KDD35_06065, partial [Bdellovibrionales bacterium]|nr:hypothetical protein [Bdellovibrionales bacterium]